MNSALYQLGKIYYFGIDVEKDTDKGLKYLELSAFKGNQSSLYQLGKIYYFGIDVEKDIVKGRYYLELSAEQGNQYAQEILDFTQSSSSIFISRIKHLSNLIKDENKLLNKQIIKDKKTMKKIRDKEISQGHKM